jgi:hypothetical protein
MAFPPRFDASTNVTSPIVVCDSILGVALQSFSSTALMLWVGGLAALVYYLSETTYR